MYRKIIFPILSRFDPENVHNFTFKFLKITLNIPGARAITRAIYNFQNPKLQRTVFGIKFSNPVGLAAGLDKDAYLFDELSAFGFGFIEVGTITPRPQSGNDKPRLFRLTADKALINRMGFNGHGALVAAERLKKRRNKNLVIGGNIGKNKITPNDEAFKDYKQAFDTLFPYVDYFVVNVSSPNTPSLRALQDKVPLLNLLNKLQEINKTKPHPKPILLKIAPDLTDGQLDDIIEIVGTTKISGVIATNTTIERTGLKTPPAVVDKIGGGGLSGQPLKNRSTAVIKYLVEKSHHAFPVVAVGGIMTAADALEKLRAGAALVQVYTGFIYSGPALVKNINTAILNNNL